MQHIIIRLLIEVCLVARPNILSDAAELKRHLIDGRVKKALFGLPDVGSLLQVLPGDWGCVNHEHDWIAESLEVIFTSWVVAIERVYWTVAGSALKSKLVLLSVYSIWHKVNDEAKVDKAHSVVYAADHEVIRLHISVQVFRIMQGLERT